MTLRETIISRAVVKPVKFEVPQWGLDIWVKPLTVRERADLGDMEEAEIQIEAILTGVVNEDGTPVFTRGDRDMIRDEFGGGAVQTIAIAILRGPSFEDIEKNSVTTPSNDSPTS